MSRPDIVVNLDLLRKPVSFDNPSGPDLTHDADDRVYRRISAARPEEGVRAASSGHDPLFQRDVAPTDWALIARLGLSALEQRTKDLQIAAWVVEALGNLRGLPGLRDGFEMTRAIQEEFWDSAHPAIEGEDMEYRHIPYAFLEEQLPPVILEKIALSGGDHRAEHTAGGFERAKKTGGSLDAWVFSAAQGGPAAFEEIAGEAARCRDAFDLWRDDLDRRHADGGRGWLSRIASAFDSLDAALTAIRTALPPHDQVDAAPADAAAEVSPTLEPVVDATSRRAQPTRAGRSEQDSAADPRGLAAELARSGDIGAAIELLDRARHSARSRRERFLRQLELAEFCVGASQFRLASPLIEELAALIEELKLEDWEDPSIPARVLDALIHTVRDRDEDDQGRIGELLLRLCRLDPRRALRHMS